MVDAKSIASICACRHDCGRGCRGCIHDGAECVNIKRYYKVEKPGDIKFDYKGRIVKR